MAEFINIQCTELEDTMKQDAPATECFHTGVCIHQRQPEMYNQVTNSESTTSFPFSEVHTKYTLLQNAARSLTIYMKVCKSSGHRCVINKKG